MSTLFDDFMKIAGDPAAVPPSEMVGALERMCPPFVVPAILRLQRDKNLTADERAALCRRVALCASDLDSLYELIGRPDADGSAFYPPQPETPTPDTDTTIDTFLETYGHGASAAEDALLERMIFNPTPDYAAMLEEEYRNEHTQPQQPADEQDKLIDAFLKEGRQAPLPPPSPDKEEPRTVAAAVTDTPEPAGGEEVREEPQAAEPPIAGPRDDSSLSESLAKIYIRQGKYDKAYEILSHLNLNIPTKSSYFADQLRFLQKLMLNSKYNPTKDK